jgi:phosphatidylglycerophosphatase A
MTTPPSATSVPTPIPTVRPNARFLFAHPAHAIALGLGSGLSPKAAGTVGSLWAWAAFLALNPWLGEMGWALVLALLLPLSWWASSTTARNLQAADPGCIVIDEVLAMWLVLWLIMPASLGEQIAAFALFRYFDAVKPGPVGWADQLYHHLDPATERWGWAKAGWGIVLDDLVAAFCTLLLMAVWHRL